MENTVQNNQQVDQQIVNQIVPFVRDNTLQAQYRISSENPKQYLLGALTLYIANNPYFRRLTRKSLFKDILASALLNNIHLELAYMQTAWKACQELQAVTNADDVLRIAEIAKSFRQQCDKDRHANPSLIASFGIGACQEQEPDILEFIFDTAEYKAMQQSGVTMNEATTSKKSGNSKNFLTVVTA